MPYIKPWLSLPDQLALLKNRGLLVEDDSAAIECLHRNGYYRLSAYWYPFRELVAGQRTDNFLPNSRFEDAVGLYVFDKEFKLQLLDALERVEIAVRVEIALLLGKRDIFALSNANIFHPNFTARINRSGQTPFQKWTDKYENAVERSTDEFVKHYEGKYGARLPLPIWIAVELWDFGLLSHLYSGLRIRDRQAIAMRFAVPDWQLMRSWLRSLNYVRNVIAHHGRAVESQLERISKSAATRYDAASRSFENVAAFEYSNLQRVLHFVSLLARHQPAFFVVATT